MVRLFALVGLLSAFSLLGGCNKPDSKSVGNIPSNGGPSQSNLNQRNEKNYLDEAKHLRKIGESKKAIALLQELITKYPNSPAAEEASQLIMVFRRPPADEGEIEDGGHTSSADRDQAEAYFARLAKVGSAEEEKKLLTEFGEWLSEHEYKIQVKVVDGKHDLSCPYFPPETPWIRHLFLDIQNLDLLPTLEAQ